MHNSCKLFGNISSNFFSFCHCFSVRKLHFTLAIIRTRKYFAFEGVQKCAFKGVVPTGGKPLIRV